MVPPAQAGGVSMNNHTEGSEAMDSNDVANLEKLLPLADKYGLAYIITLILLMIMLVLLRSIVKGNLVPRELLERAEEDRDRLQNILDKERSDFMAPTLEVLQRLKIDHSAGNHTGSNSINEEDRGDNVLSAWIKRLSPLHRDRERRLALAGHKVSLSIRRYKNVSQDIQDEIRNNGFAEFLIYDRGAEDEQH